MDNNYTNIINELIVNGSNNVDEFDYEQVSDGFHTFGELYEFRKLYNALLFNEWAKHYKFSVHKSLRHYNGEKCFDGSWFIVSAMLPSGQISNHYKIEDWDLFDVPIADKAIFAFDGHTTGDVIKRLKETLEDK